MKTQIRKWLLDIQMAVTSINMFVGERRQFEYYQKNEMLQRAVERELEIIGEAINRILAKDPTISIDSARKIVQLRNYTIHAYDSISNEIIWGIVIRSLPNLRRK